MDMNMRTIFKFATPWLILLLLPLLSCAPGVSTEEYNALNAELGKTESSLAQANAKLAETNTALTAANDEITGLRAALDEAKAPFIKEQAACFERVLGKRRSVRDYADSPLTKDEVMKLLWAGQGITGAMGARTAPSAGAFYPLRVYLVVGNVKELSPGVYKYKPEGNTLAKVKDGDVRSALTAAALDQRWVKEGAVDIVIAAVYEETATKYGVKAERFVHLEAGHAAQNILLEATALELGAVPVGGFDDAKVAMTIGLSRNENPLYIIPVGRKR